MNPEQIFSMIILSACCGGCGAVCLYIGNHAKNSKKPVSLWANGNPIDPKAVSDIPAYNAAFGKLFRRYSIPYFLIAVIGIIGIRSDWGSWAVLILLFFWAFPGTLWLISEYRKIEKTYVSP